jgi:hypothetical protein
VPNVAAHRQGIVKEDILGLLGCNFVALPVCDSVRFIPIESDALAKWIAGCHNLYISHMYNYGKVSAAMGAGEIAEKAEMAPIDHGGSPGVVLY